MMDTIMHVVGFETEQLQLIYQALNSVNVNGQYARLLVSTQDKIEKVLREAQDARPTVPKEPEVAEEAESSTKT